MTQPALTTPPRRGMSLAMKCLLWTFLSFASGAIGGAVGDKFFEAPFYFGFFFTWTLVGLTGMFVIAAHVGKQMEQAERERSERLTGSR